MAKKPETVFKERIKPHLDRIPHSWWVKIQMLSLAGIPDYLGCINGRFVALELKKDGKTDASLLQGWVLSKIRAAGGIALKVDPENWQATYNLLQRIACKPLPDECTTDLSKTH